MDVIDEYQNFIEKNGDALSRLLGRAQINLLEKLRNQLFQDEGIDLSLSQFHCLQFLCLKGSCQRDLADRLGVSKQALHQLIKDLEKKDLIYKESDPADARLKIIRHTKRGKKVVATIIQITMHIENNLIASIGEKNFKALKKSLSIIESL